jgi:hypothetical protein
LITAGCKTSIVSAQSPISKIVSENFGDTPTEQELNPDKTHLLVVQEKTATTEGLNTLFIVIRLSDNTIILKDRISRGYVRWLDNHNLEKLNIPGKVQPDADLARYKTIVSIDHPVAPQK